MDKIDRLLDAVERPDHYSAERLNEMFSDGDTSDAYDLMSIIKGAFTETPSVDVDAEWREFERRHFRSKPSVIASLSRPTAAAIVGIVATLAVVAAGIGYSVAMSRKPTHEPAVAADVGGALAPAEAKPFVTNDGEVYEPTEIIIFKEDNLDKILAEIAGYYGVEVVFHNDDAKSLRLHLKWDQAKPLTEVVEMLNKFEHISIALSGNTLIVE